MDRIPRLVYQATNVVIQYRRSLVLLLGAAHGLIYVFLIPPWQHYDEPGNFEYAWLVANYEGLPERGDHDQSMRREVSASMIEHNFYENIPGMPNMLSLNQPKSIGIPQTSDPPLYYQLVSLPLSLLRGTDITFQLHIGRLISWALFNICILSAWGLMNELTQPRHPLRWMVPFSLALLPGFVDIMTAVNNDVGATAFFSLFLWGAVITIKHGLSWRRLFWIMGTTILCLFTKSTVYFVLPLLGITVLFAIFRGKRRRWAWHIIGVCGIGLFLIAFTWGEVTQWYRHDPYNYQTRHETTEAPLGDHVFLIAIQKGKTNPQISQGLTLDKIDIMRGKPVTIGAWVWADSSMIVRLPILNAGDKNTTQPVEIGRTPNFFAYHTEIEEDVTQVHILLSPLTTQSQEDVNIYFDGVILALGNYPTDRNPEFRDSEMRGGLWGGKYFENLLDNPSAEFGGINLRPNINEFIQKYFPINLSWVLNSIADWKKSAWYYESTVFNLLRTFWAKFGWGHVHLLGSKPYRFLAGITLLGLIGSGGYLQRRKTDQPWEVIFLFGSALLFIWGATFYRGIYSLIRYDNRVFIPSARYAYPVVIPTMLFLNIGWLECMRFFQKWTRIPRYYLRILFILFFISLDVISLMSIYRYYYI